MNDNDAYYTAELLAMYQSHAIKDAIRHYYGVTNFKEWTKPPDMQHLADHGSVTNFSDGRMEFAIADTILVGFGVIEYKVDIEENRVVMRYIQDIERHF